MNENVIQISDYELELMKIIWTNGGEAMYSDIYDNLMNSGNTWTKNTIITLLSRLIDKGALSIDKIGRRNKYIAILTEDNYRTAQTVRFVNKTFAGNMQGLVNTLIENELLTSSDIDELKNLWAKGERHE